MEHANAEYLLQIFERTELKIEVEWKNRNDVNNCFCVKIRFCSFFRWLIFKKKQQASVCVHSVQLTTCVKSSLKIYVRRTWHTLIRCFFFSNRFYITTNVCILNVVYVYRFNTPNFTLQELWRGKESNG